MKTQRLTAAWACLLIVFAVAGSSQAIPVIDQNQPSGPTPMATFGQSDLAQSFQQSASNVVGAGFFMMPGWGFGGDVTIALYSALPNQAGTLLAQGTAAALPGQWLDVFWSPVSVVPDQTYYLVPTGTDISMCIAGDANNPYPRGMVFANPGYNPFPQYDYTFRTYAAGAGVIPEPLTMICAVATLGGLGAYLRGRRIASAA